MKLRACLALSSFFFFSSSFANPATTDGLHRILVDIFKSAGHVMEHSGENLEQIRLVRGDYNDISAALKELTSLTDVENVRSKSGKAVKNISAAIEDVKPLTRQVQKIIDDYDQLLELLKTMEPGSPEAAPFVARAWRQTMEFSGFMGETQMSHSMNTLLNLLYALNDAV